MDMKFLTKKRKLIGMLIISFIFIFLILGFNLQKNLVDICQNQESIIIKDRKEKEIFIIPNQKKYWSIYMNEVPDRFKELLLKKEDKYFYYHLGFNPWSISQALLHYVGIGDRKGSSTLTQQLVKILLKNEFKRSLKNKIIESLYVLNLEAYQSKETILKMYVNSVYFGNQAQGLKEASRLYFNTDPDLLSDEQILQLLSTINSPTQNNPAQLKNNEAALALAKKLNFDEKNLIFTNYKNVEKNMNNYSRFNSAYFEIKSFINNEKNNNQLTIDLDLTEKTRNILERNIEELKLKNVNQGAVIIIKLPENEILALIGSTDPNSFNEASQINMLQEPRPIGSTIKPFIYLKAFEKDLRPYTLVDDREYKYITALGFPLYPKNFDYKYRGEVSLHYALSNSLNVPSVKVLEYVGLENFYNFLEKDLEFKPIQNLNNYQLGIALGALEMNLFDLSRYFTIFPNKGILKDLKIFRNSESSEKNIAQEKYVQLINKILNDRKTSIEQFGMKSWLNLFQENYALKTGTSRDFRDSWVIGFTPDFLVGVWLGNADNSPMDEVSGQMGAGRVWSQIMDLLLNSEYNEKTPFNFGLLKEFRNQENNIEYGLATDDYDANRLILKEKDFSIVLSPHNGDVFLLEENTKIFLKAKEKVKWSINNEFLEENQNALFSPQKSGLYQISAENSKNEKESVYILLNSI
ncbi:MAG: transglycosylase domain-containing protein [Candidatus Nealsonbacteria bacterium]|nr:transglycosylase domain-containing protein [Candidatus Nealsonbacteria bacterium]